MKEQKFQTLLIKMFLELAGTYQRKPIQDAVIICTMYALALDPYSLHLLIYEGIINDKARQYWDHKTSKLKNIAINQDLLTDLNYFKLYSNNFDTNCKEQIRNALYGTSLKGTFILNLSPTNIYNRFKIEFGDKLKWFNFTPLNIIQLSQYRVKISQKDFIPALESKIS